MGNWRRATQSFLPLPAASFISHLHEPWSPPTKGGTRTAFSRSPCLRLLQVSAAPHMSAGREDNHRWEGGFHHAGGGWGWYVVDHHHFQGDASELQGSFLPLPLLCFHGKHVLITASPMAVWHPLLLPTQPRQPTPWHTRWFLFPARGGSRLSQHSLQKGFSRPTSANPAGFIPDKCEKPLLWNTRCILDALFSFQHWPKLSPLNTAESFFLIWGSWGRMSCNALTSLYAASPFFLFLLLLKQQSPCLFLWGHYKQFSSGMF